MKWLVALLLLAACGGGNSPVVGAITPTGVLRGDLLYGYYGQTSSTILETREHANLYWGADFKGLLEQFAGMSHAKGAGMKTVLALPGNHADPAVAEGSIRFFLDRLKAAGLLWSGIVAVTWGEEINTLRGGNFTNAAATARSDLVRRVLMEYPELDGVKLAVDYACEVNGVESWPGIASFDWVGCNRYIEGCAVLQKHVARLAELLGPRQRLLIFPGGASPWLQDPKCFEEYAHSEVRVVAIIAFLWQTETDEGVTFTGIRELPLQRRLYCQVGKKILNPKQPPIC